MKEVLIATLLFVNSEAITNLVIGGQNAPKGSAPFIAAILGPVEFVCEAAIIKPQWVLTAALCISKPATYVVAVGSNVLDSNQLMYKTSKIIRHEKYNATTLANNIALLKTRQSFYFDDDVKSIEIATSNPTDGEVLALYGWGGPQVCLKFLFSAMKLKPGIFPNRVVFTKVFKEFWCPTLEWPCVSI